MSRMSNLDAKLRAAGIDPEEMDLEIYWEKQQSDAYLAYLGIAYVGRQERHNDFPLDMFNDLVTGSTFLRGEMESVLDLAERIRKGHTM